VNRFGREVIKYPNKICLLKKDFIQNRMESFLHFDRKKKLNLKKFQKYFGLGNAFTATFVTYLSYMKQFMCLVF